VNKKSIQTAERVKKKKKDDTQFFSWSSEIWG